MVNERTLKDNLVITLLYPSMLTMASIDVGEKTMLYIVLRSSSLQ